MRKNALNVVLFLFLAAGMFFLWQYANENFAQKDVERKEAARKEDGEKLKKEAEKEAARQQEAADKRQTVFAAGGGLAVAIELPKPKPPESPKISATTLGEIDLGKFHAAITSGMFDYVNRPTLIALGTDKFYNRVLLSTRGGGVQQVVLPKFGQADRLGREVKLKDNNGNATKDIAPLYLIPGIPYPRSKELREDYVPPTLQVGKVDHPVGLAEPSYTVFHYPIDNHPDPYLGVTNWLIVSDEHPDEGDHKVVFEKELGEPYFVKIRKTYTLGPKDYHVGLRIEIEKLKVPGSAKGKGQFRYQLSGPRGLPIEGEWYTSTYRVAIVGWRDKNSTPRRQYEDSASIGNKRGGEQVNRADNSIKYMVVANQFFASGVAIDDRADDTFEKGMKNPWLYVRATTEIPFDKKQDPQQTQFDDVTVRAATDALDLGPGEKVAHSYMIYNGPSKVGLLELIPKGQDRDVSVELVNRYKDGLTLSTITDFRSDTWIGRFASTIGWTDLVIMMTNVMHWLLAKIHWLIPNWALSIVILTMCVRLLLLMPSRKQTAMSMKMMEVQKKLQPEFEKLQEKYKDDFHSFQREKSRLMFKHGANPFAMMGGCLLLVAQMPIMMGLYFCLQESVFFRLDSFLWIDNLAAPDMLVWWTEGIPFISTTEDIGSLIYLGPYFNLLPLLAVGLMLYQQAKMMPPSTDPQAEQQRMMMKMMMIMMAVFFYKVAAGLALYFIVSTGWAIIERQFIPKPKIDGFGPDADGDGATSSTLPKSTTNNKLSPTAEAAVAEARRKNKGLLGRLREKLQEKMEEMQKKADEQSKRQIRNDQNRPADDSSASPRSGSQPPPNDPRRDKKKKRKG